jgi:hypothetical protein
VGAGGTKPGEDHRVAELLRVNAELAAELRSIGLGRRDSPRTGPVPAARRLAQLNRERDEARAESHTVRAELDAVNRERDELRRLNAELAREVARLRGGLRGFLRRVRARVLLRR